MVLAKQLSDEIRSLLWIWFAQRTAQPPTQAQVVRKLKRKAEAAADYRKILKGLIEAEAVAVKEKACILTPKGEARLAEGLLKSDFELPGTIVGSWVANALLAWLRSDVAQQPTAAPSSQNALNGRVDGVSIQSYEDFQAVALETYERLNQDYNLDDLVPIYRIRRELGDRLSRSDFNAWLLEMQAEDILQLIGGEMSELTPDKAEDSVKTRMGDIRYYAQRL